MELKETNHSYYCECWETKYTGEFNSWADFKMRCGLNYDFDYNLLFRFDIEEKEDDNGNRTGEYILKLHHALQRHGNRIWHVIIYNITDDDMKEIEMHLKKAKQHLLDMWKEV